MSLAANRPLNWNVLQLNSPRGEINENKLAPATTRPSAAPGLAPTMPPRLDPHPPLVSQDAFLLDVLQRAGEADGVATRREGMRAALPIWRGGASCYDYGAADRRTGAWASPTGRVFTVARGVHAVPRPVRRPDGRRDRGDRRQRALGCRPATSRSPTGSARSSPRPTEAPMTRAGRLSVDVWRDPRGNRRCIRRRRAPRLPRANVQLLDDDAGPRRCASGACSPVGGRRCRWLIERSRLGCTG